MLNFLYQKSENLFLAWRIAIVTMDTVWLFSVFLNKYWHITLKQGITVSFSVLPHSSFIDLQIQLT